MPTVRLLGQQALRPSAVEIPAMDDIWIVTETGSDARADAMSLVTCRRLATAADKQKARLPHWDSDGLDEPKLRL